MHKYLNRTNLEDMGNYILHLYHKAVPALGMMPHRVDPANVAEVVMGLKTSFLPLSSDGHILGLAPLWDMTLEVEDADGAVYEIRLTNRDIVIDVSLQEKGKTARLNFTIAHEFAHHILAYYYPQYYVSEERTLLYRYKPGMHRDQDWVEQQANGLAEVILMPAETIFQCIEMFHFRPEAGPRAVKTVGDIASFLGVSQQALAIRMKRLNLIDEPFLANFGLHHK